MIIKMGDRRTIFRGSSQGPTSLTGIFPGTWQQTGWFTAFTGSERQSKGGMKKDMTETKIKVL